MERRTPEGQSKSNRPGDKTASVLERVSKREMDSMPSVGCASFGIAALILLLPSAIGQLTYELWPNPVSFLPAGPLWPSTGYALYYLNSYGIDPYLSLHAWLLIAIPYAALSLFALMRAQAFIRGAETRLKLAFYLVLPVLVSAAVVAYLNWLSTTCYYMLSEKTIWYPVLAAPALIGIMALLLRRSFRRTLTNKELSSQPTI